MEVEIFKLLSDPNRYKIFTLLIFTECCICDLEAQLNLKQANVSKHMMKFRALDVVDFRKDAQWVYYSLNKDFRKAHQKLIDYIKNKALEDPKLTHIINDIQNKCLCKIKRDGGK